MPRRRMWASAVTSPRSRTGRGGHWGGLERPGDFRAVAGEVPGLEQGVDLGHRRRPPRRPEWESRHQAGATPPSGLHQAYARPAPDQHRNGRERGPERGFQAPSRRVRSGPIVTDTRGAGPRDAARDAGPCPGPADPGEIAGDKEAGNSARFPARWHLSRPPRRRPRERLAPGRAGRHVMAMEFAPGGHMARPAEAAEAQAATRFSMNRSENTAFVGLEPPSPPPRPLTRRRSPAPRGSRPRPWPPGNRPPRGSPRPGRARNGGPRSGGTWHKPRSAPPDWPPRRD